MYNKKIAMEFIAGIKEIASKPENLANFESYLTYNFSEWMKKYADTPENITAELQAFAKMEF